MAGQDERHRGWHGNQWQWESRHPAPEISTGLYFSKNSLEKRRSGKQHGCHSVVHLPQQAVLTSGGRVVACRTVVLQSLVSTSQAFYRGLFWTRCNLVVSAEWVCMVGVHWMCFRNTPGLGSSENDWLCMPRCHSITWSKRKSVRTTGILTSKVLFWPENEWQVERTLHVGWCSVQN